MKGFEQLWTSIAKTRDGEPVSPELRAALAAGVRRRVDQPRQPPSSQAKPHGIAAVPERRRPNNANCWAADLFFCSDDDLWEHDWSEQNLPDDFHDVMAMMGEALHDTVSTPDIAENFGCLPEQLLERVERMEL